MKIVKFLLGGWMFVFLPLFVQGADAFSVPIYAVGDTYGRSSLTPSVVALTPDYPSADNVKTYVTAASARAALSSVSKTGYTLDASSWSWTRFSSMLTTPTFTASWCSNNSKSVDSSMVPTNATMMFVDCTPITYTLVFSNAVDGVMGAVSPQLLAYDQPATLPTSILQRAGYDFAGWSKTKGGDVDYAGGATVSNLSTVADGQVRLWSCWSAKSYTVTLDAAGGVGGLTSVSVEMNKNLPTISSQSLPTRPGYTFGGYYTAQNGNGSCLMNAEGKPTSTTYSVPSNSVLYAAWTANSYVVVYHENGWDNETRRDSSFRYDVAQNLSRNTWWTPAGYIFQGWSTCANGIVVYEGGQSVTNLTLAANGTVDLYAVWSLKRSSIAFEANEGEGDFETLTNLNCETAVWLPRATYTRTGYRFAGWSLSRTGEVVVVDGGCVTNLVADTTFYARWEPSLYIVHYDPNGGSGGTSIPDQTNAFDRAEVLAANTYTKDGSYFLCWSNTVSGEVYANGGVVSNLATAALQVVDLSAVWGVGDEQQYYNVRYNANGGTGTKDDDSLPFGRGGVLTPNTTITRTGYDFLGWTDPRGRFYADGAVVTSLVSTAYGTIELSAKWIRIDTCTFKLFRGYSAEGVGESNVTVACGEAMVPTCPWDRTGYSFLNWTNDSGDAYLAGERVSDATNLNLYAVWKAGTYTVVYQPNGATLGKMDEQTVEWGTSTTLQSNRYERAGWRFDGWRDVKGRSYNDGDSILEAVDPCERFELLAQWKNKSQTKSVALQTESGMDCTNIVEYTPGGTWSNLPSFPDDLYPDRRFLGWCYRNAGGEWITVTNGMAVSENLDIEQITELVPFWVAVPENGYAQALGCPGVKFTVSGTDNGWSVTESSNAVRVCAKTTATQTLTATLDNAPGKLSFDWWISESGAEKTLNVFSFKTDSSSKPVTNITVSSGRVSFTNTIDSEVKTVTWRYGWGGDYPNDNAGTGYIQNVVWTPNRMTVSLDANGGGGVDAEKSFERGQYELPEPSRLGYKFMGWWTQPMGLDAARQVKDGDPLLNAVTNLYAHWSVQTYSVEYRNLGGAVNDANPTNRTIEDGAVVLAAPTRAGYVFNGWVPKGVIDAGQISNLVFTADWKAVDETVVYDLQGGENVSPPKRDGYEFTGWTMRTNACGVVIKTAGWTPISYSIAYSNLVDAVNDGNPTNYTAESGVIVLAAPIRDGYEFTGWQPTNAVVSAAALSNLVFTATWSRIVPKFTVSYLMQGGENDPLNPKSITDEDEMLLKDPLPYCGYQFMGWSPTNRIAKGTSTNLVFTANWLCLTNKVTYELEGGVNDSSNPVEFTVEDDDIYLVAPTRVGYVFTGWLPTNRIEKGTTSTNLVFTATWRTSSSPADRIDPRMITYAVEFLAGDGTDRMATQTISCGFVDKLIACPFTRAGYVFAGWARASAANDIVFLDQADVQDLAAEGETLVLTAVWTATGADSGSGDSGSDDSGDSDSGDSGSGDSGGSGSADPGTNTPVVVVSTNRLYATVEPAVLTVAGTYDGYLYDRDGMVKGIVQVKVSKYNAKKDQAKVTASVTEVGGKKRSYKGGLWTKSSTSVALTSSSDARVLRVVLGARGLSGTWGDYGVDGALNVFASKDTALRAECAAVLANWQKTLALAVADADGWCGFSATIASKGKVKIVGTLTDGTRVSVSSQLLLGSDICCIPVVYVKKTVSLAFALWLNPANGTSATVRGLGDNVALAPVGPALATGSVFQIDAAECRASWGSNILSDYLPSGLSVVQNNRNKWIVADGTRTGKVVYVKGTQEVDVTKLLQNPSALKLALTAKTGVFKGSFKLYRDVSGRLKSSSVTVTGILVDGVGYGSAQIKKVGAVPIRIESE